MTALTSAGVLGPPAIGAARTGAGRFSRRMKPSWPLTGRIITQALRAEHVSSGTLVGV